MTFKKKRKLKKMAKLFTWLSIATFVLYVALIATIIALPVRMKSTLTAAFIVTMPIIAIVVLWFTGMQCSIVRESYLGSIREWRSRNFFTITMTIILGGGKPSKIRPYYASINNGTLIDIITGMFIHSLYVSEEPRFAEIGREMVEKLLAKYDPAAVKF